MLLKRKGSQLNLSLELRNGRQGGENEKKEKKKKKLGRTEDGGNLKILIKEKGNWQPPDSTLSGSLIGHVGKMKRGEASREAEMIKEKNKAGKIKGGVSLGQKQGINKKEIITVGCGGLWFSF